MKWLHLLHLLLFLVVLGSVSNAQVCTPDPALADNETGLYPEPFHPTENVNGGITEPAYNDKPYEFLFTLVLGDTISDGSNTIVVNELHLLTVTGLPNGLEVVSSPGDGEIEANTSACLLIRGTPDDVAGVYDISIQGRLFFGGSNVTITFPDDGRFPSQRYLLTLEDGCPTDVCDGFSALATVQQGVSCGTACDGRLELGVTGGTAPFTYNWSGGASGNTTSIATDLCSGSYRATVTDANGCSSNTIMQVQGASGSGFTLNVAGTDADCAGGNGTATATTSGGTMPFTYAWSGGENTASISNLSAGQYMVTVMDANGCSMTESVMVGSSSGITASLGASSDVSCNGLSDGTATISTGGGTGFTYTWSGSAAGTSGATATALDAGNYMVTVMDGSGCVANVSFTINEPTPLAVTINKVDADCTSGSATATVTGGTSVYSYMWSNNQTTASISNLSGGMYSLTVTDANDCTITETVVINEPANALSVSASVISDASCNGTNDGGAMANPSGGTGSYSYAWSNGSTSASVNNLPGGIHTVTVTDASDCSNVGTVTISEPNSITLNTSASDVSCAGDTNGSLSVSATGGNSGFTYNWSGGLGSNASVNNVPANTYTVTVTDADGCTETATETINEPAALVVTISSDDVSCDGNTLGTASAMVTGGTGNYSYAWSASGTSATISNLAGGNYQVTITDAANCSITESFTINAVAVPLQANIAASSNVSCNGAADGTASVTATGGTGGYTYQWSDGNTTASSISSLSEGTFRVTIEDNGGCSVVETVVISEPSAIVINSSTSDVSCSGQTNGTISLTISGGSGGYSYAWDNGLPNNASQSGLNSGTYNVTVTDSDGCSNNSSIVVDEPLLVGITATTTDVECAGESSASASINIAGGTAPFSYMWSNNFTGSQSSTLSAGMYTVTVSDANNCVGEVSFTIIQPSVLNANATAAAEATVGDGRAAAEPTGGIPPYSYSWSNSSTSPIITGLSPDFYTVTVTDANGCSVVESVTVSASGCAGLVSLTIDATNISCNGESDGMAVATGAGGAFPYSYIWSNGQSGSNITGLGLGSYTVTVTDNDGCPATANIMITQPGGIITSLFNQMDVSCTGNSDGLLEAQALGGTAPYSYEWSTNEMDNRIEGLSGGVYFYTVTDVNGCTTTANAIILEPNELSVDIANIANVNCSGADDGIATVDAEGGTSPYTYAWSNQGTTASQSNLSAGTYTISVTDARGCTVDTMLTVNAAVQLQFDIVDQSEVNCNGGNDGTANIEATGGTGTFTYSWSNGLTGSSANNLEEGFYTITATDGNACSETLALTVRQPDVLTLATTATNQSATGADDGGVSVTVMGGRSPYTYLWDTPDAATTESVSDLPPGTYTVIVTDANACTNTESVTISSVDCALSATISSTDVPCNGGLTGTASVEVIGDTNPLRYLWSNDAVLPTVTGLGAGTYSVTITEENGCTTMATTIINEPAVLRATIVDSGDIACGGSMNGFAQVEVGGGAGGYNIFWSNGSIDERIDGLAMGAYTVTVSDANGCNDMASVQINETEGLNLSISGVQNVDCAGEASGAATIEPNGGTAPYSYIWSNGNATATATNLAAGTYTATVNDLNGCNNEIEIEIEEPTSLSASVASNTPTLCNGATGSAGVTPAGGLGPYTYLWSTGSTEALAVDLAVGSHTVSVTDTNGCSTEASITLELAAALSLTLSSSSASNINASDGTASVGVEGGTMPFTYTWTNAAGMEIGSAATMNDLAPGEYTIFVSDVNDCSASSMVLIEEEGCSGFSLMLDVVQPSCGGTSLGSISPILNNATEPISYQWSNDATTASLENTDEGTYSVTVTDGNACSAVASASLEISNGFDIALQEMTPMTCQNIANGTARLETTGGVAPYTFLWPVEGDSSNYRTNLVSGYYTITVFDAAACTNTIGFSVARTTDEEPPTVVTQTATIYLDAFGNANLRAEEVDGGTTDNCGLQEIRIDRATFSCADLGTAVNVTLLAEDRTGNTAAQTAQVSVLDTFPPILICPNDILLQQCEAENNVEFSLPNAFDNCGESLTPILVDGRPSGASFPLGETVQTFSATDASGNRATCSFLVLVETFDVTNITVNEPTCFNFPNGSATVSVTGAMPPLTFNWSNGTTEATATSLVAGDYTVTVTDGNNCNYVETVSIMQPPLLNVTLDGITNEINEEGTGLINVSVVGGRAPYRYSWTLDGAEVSNEEDLFNVSSGIYRLQITDANGCNTITEEIVVLLTDTNDFLEATAVRLLPNPTSGIIQLQVDLPQTLPYTANLYDLNGRLLRQLIHTNGQEQQHQFDLSTYSSGVYFVRIQVENSLLTKRVVLIKD